MSKTPNESGSSGRIAGIDFGTVRIGIAITDPQQKIASLGEHLRTQVEGIKNTFASFGSGHHDAKVDDARETL